MIKPILWFNLNKINALPPKCSIVFKMSRFEEMNYAKIAEQLGITKKTVEYHISTALRLLRKSIFTWLFLPLANSLYFSLKYSTNELSS
ncbi:MAG: sigma factor-like helix-turn-helix DNA-binding protein [Saprospiraceae bacterium]